MTAETVETQHGPDCTCPVVTRIETVLVAVTDGCPGDRSQYRASRISDQIADDFEHLVSIGVMPNPAQ